MRRACAAALAAIAVVAPGCGGDEPSPTDGESVALDARSPRVPPGSRMRVLVELRRPSLGDRMAGERLDRAAQRAHVASLESEANALLSALRAKDVETRSPVLYTRAWAGFAVTLDPGDLPAVQALGLRAEPVRWFYGAAATETPRGARAAAASTFGRGRPALALLDSGVARLPALRGRLVSGFDAVDRDRDPAPHGPRELHGTAVASVLAGELPRRERVLAIRVAARQGAEGAPPVEAAATDQLLAGLERTVDPDGDGSVDDHVPIALVGVSSPYSGFPGAPEAEAVRAASRIGTLVVAPAGNEGPATGAFGTIGSPGAAPDALAVGALDGGRAPGVPSVELGLATGEGRAKLEGALLGGAGRALRAPVTPLTGRSQANPRGGGRSTGGSPLDYLDVEAAPKTRGKVVVVPARAGAQGERPSLAQRAAAAQAAGAVALVVCETDDEVVIRALPAGASGGMPVVGLAGDDARRALELTEEAGGLAFLSEPDARDAQGRRRVASASSRGPTYALAPKPDLVAPGTAETLGPAGGRALASGTSIAAARVAAAALRAHRRTPALAGARLAAALIGTARPAGPTLAAGAGEPNPNAAARARVVAVPATSFVADRTASANAFTLVNLTARSLAVELTATIDSGLRTDWRRRRLRLAPRGRARGTVTVQGEATRRSGFATGRIAVRDGLRSIAIPLLVPLAPSPAPKVESVRAIERRGQVSAVRFSAGSVRRAGDAVAVEPVGVLRLELVDGVGKPVRELTPPGGATDILPGEYSYTLPENLRRGLRGPGYRFRVSVRGVAGGSATAASQPFELR